MNGPAVRRVSWTARALFVAVLALSLYLRLENLGAFMTIDEWSWRQRSIAFRSALREHKLASTYQSEHPGVVNMWIGSAADILEWKVGPVGSAPYTGGRGIPGLTLWARRIIAAATWCGILVMYWLLRRLWGERIAMAGATLVALDPFYLAYSRFHHLDALMTTFATISILALLIFGKERKWLFLALSAVAAGLGIANKISGIVLVPWAGIALLIMARESANARSWLARFWQRTRPALPWGLLALATIFAIWPALWVNPVGTLHQMMLADAEQAMNPHAFWNFFWHQIRPDPGPGLYPVVWAFRTTPWVMLGVAALAALRPKGGRRDMAIWSMAAWALLFALAMTASPKKFDRYLLPIFPVVDVLAALGLARLWRRLREWRPEWRWWRESWLMAGGLVVAATTGALILPTMPYVTSYYNPVVGGAKVAPGILLMGWGEGLDQVGRYLDSRPNSDDLVVAAQGNNELEPYTHSTVVYIDDLPVLEPDYYVLFISNVQRQFVFDIFAYFYTQQTPEFVARSNGIEYAWVYPNTYYQTELQSLMDQIATQADAEPAVVFNVDAAFRRHYTGPVATHVISGSARRDYVQTELTQAAAGHEGLWLIHVPDIYPEIYETLSAELAAAGEATAHLTAGDLSANYYALPQGHTWVAATPQVQTDYRLGDAMRLLGFDPPVGELAPGVTASFRLYWRAEQPLDDDWKVFIHVLGPDGTIYAQADAEPQGFSRPTHTWEVGRVIPDDYEVEIPADAPEGVYSVVVGMYNGDTMERITVISGADVAPIGDQITLWPVTGGR